MPRRIGRPMARRPDMERVPLATRVPGATFNKLIESAELNDRTLGNEVEMAIERGFSRAALLPDVLEARYGRQLGELLIFLGDAMLAVARQATFAQTHRPGGADDLLSNGPVYKQAADAARAILDGDCIVPPGADEPIPFLYAQAGNPISEKLSEENQWLGINYAAEQLGALCGSPEFAPLRPAVARFRQVLDEARGSSDEEIDQ